MKALLFFIVIGIVLGLAWPSGQAGSPLAPAVTASAAGDDEPRETVLERSEGGHFYANVEVNGQLVRFLIDTGATGVALTEADAERIGLQFSRGDYEQVGMGAAGPVRGKFVTLEKVSLDGKTARDIEGAILEGGDMSLLGQNYLGRFSVEMRGDTMRIY
ncbi:MAG TPA: TIGR02281 family clan AA aspartic protease [Allosphingosinicella sp.]|jgi:aspartyl protease family protein